MSKGKYSPSLTRAHCARDFGAFCYNADKQLPPERDLGEEYDTRLHFGNYDAEGFDRYGYSAFDADGNYIGIGEGIDRWGYTESEYTSMSDEDFDDICY